MSNIIRHQTIMTIRDSPFLEVKKFGNTTDEEMAEGIIPEGYYLTAANWKAMGEPEVITVTIVPGDILNNPPTEGDSNG